MQAQLKSADTVCKTADFNRNQAVDRVNELTVTNTSLSALKQKLEDNLQVMTVSVLHLQADRKYVS